MTVRMLDWRKGRLDIKILPTMAASRRSIQTVAYSRANFATGLYTAYRLGYEAGRPRGGM